jgi:hypothetical protein
MLGVRVVVLIFESPPSDPLNKLGYNAQAGDGLLSLHWAGSPSIIANSAERERE